MIKQFSLLLLCTLSESSVHAMNDATNNRVLTVAGVLGGCILRYGYRWWRLRPFVAELAHNPHALHQACLKGDLQKVTSLLNAGAYVNSRDDHRLTPLHYASLNGYRTIVALLLKHGASVDSKCVGDDTPLHRASYWGYKEVVELLIKYGAYVDSKNMNGWTPLHEALCWRHTEVVECLIKHNASMMSATNNGWIALHHAALSGGEEAIKIILCAGIFPLEPCVPTPSSETSLQERCLINLLNNLDTIDKDSVKEHIVPCFAHDLVLHPQKNNLLHLITHGTPLTLQRALVKEWQRSPSQENISKHNLLIDAHCNRHLNKIQDMLKLQNNDLETALDIALRENHKRVVTLLKHFHNALSFDQLDAVLKKMITQTLQRKLLMIDVE